MKIEDYERILQLERIKDHASSLEKELWDDINSGKTQEAYMLTASLIGASPLSSKDASELLPDGIDPSEKGIQPFQIAGKNDTHLFGDETVIKKYKDAKQASNSKELIDWFAKRQPLVSSKSAVISSSDNLPTYLIMKRIPGWPGHRHLAWPDDFTRLRSLEMLVDAAATLQITSTGFPKTPDMHVPSNWYVKRVEKKLEPLAEVRGMKIDNIVSAVQPHNDRILQAPNAFQFMYLDLGPQNFLFSRVWFDHRAWPTGIMKIDFDDRMVRCGIADVLTIIYSPYSRMRDVLKRKKVSVKKYLFDRWLAHLFGPCEAAMMGFQQARQLSRVAAKCLNTYGATDIRSLYASEAIIRNLTLAGDKALAQKEYGGIISELEAELNLSPGYKEKDVHWFPGNLNRAANPGSIGSHGAPIRKEGYFTDEERAQIPLLRYQAFVLFNEWLKYAEMYHVNQAKSIAEAYDLPLAHALEKWLPPKQLIGSITEPPDFGEALFRTKSNSFLENRMLETALEQFFHYNFEAE